jgi:hypothetical protein
MDEHERQENSEGAEPKLLYHYTTEKGLYGILEKSSIWATQFRFLNDFTELQDFIGPLTKRIGQRDNSPHGSPPSREMRRLLGEKAIQNLGVFIESLDVFLLSLTYDSDSPVRGDRLSQWRGYGRGGRVFSLGFYPDRLKLKAEAFCESNKLLPIHGPLQCHYGNNDVSSLVRDALVHHINVDEIGRSPIKPESDEAHWLVALIASFKHEGFYEEEEQRLAFQIPAAKHYSPLVEFHDGAFGRSPHIALPLDLKRDDSPLRRIVVGPSPDKEQVVTNLKLHLERFGIVGVEVVPSKIPYRNW